MTDTVGFIPFDPAVAAVEPGDIIGYTRSGQPVFAVGGSARNTMEAWIPVEYSSDVIQRVNQVSAIEAFAQRIPMATQTRSTPRSGGVGVGLVSKGGAYSEDASTNDDVTLRVQKFGQAIRIAEEDIADTLASVIDVKARDWATSYGKALDNACLGVSVARGTSGCAFDSVYYTLTQADAGQGYTANQNRIQTAGTGANPTYAQFSSLFGALEGGDYWDDANMVVIAHPAFKGYLRGVLDSNNRPIFQESTNGTAGGGQGNAVDTVFGVPVHWSLGSRTNTTVSATPTGNPLMFIANRNLLMLGVRSGPESVFIDGRSGLAALTDESILKMRSRRGFALGTPNAVAVLERIP
jgi:HK97 family phage major capsid protein